MIVKTHLANAALHYQLSKSKRSYHLSIKSIGKLAVNEVKKLFSPP
ncbi:MAG: hypothetical protein H7101_08675 [Deinococcales bacterium]|nr:hypothetical protein [Chitinophagaceae bacterium]